MDTANKKDKKHDFSVFNNYKCDGQLCMKFEDNTVKFEEQKENKEIKIMKFI